MTANRETVGELVERLGEQAAMNFLVAQSIELRQLLTDVATAASRIATPVCDDGGFHHCCGGTYGCKSDCAIQQVQALVRHDLRPYVRPLDSGSQGPAE